MASRGKPIYLDNDDEPEYAAEEKDATRTWIPSAGLTLTVYLSATEGGSTIHATLSKSMTEASGKAGTYYARYEGTDLRTQLLASVGKDVFEAVGNGTDVLEWAARRVMATRPV